MVFLKIEPAKFGVLSGFTLEMQYEHYFGLDVNRQDDALLAVNTAQANLRAGGYHSALSLVASQKIDENLSISVGKFNLLTMASKTPLIGGGAKYVYEQSLCLAINRCSLHLGDGRSW